MLFRSIKITWTVRDTYDWDQTKKHVVLLKSPITEEKVIVKDSLAHKLEVAGRATPYKITSTWKEYIEMEKTCCD